MRNKFLNKAWLKPSNHPANHIPAGSKPIIGVDHGSPDKCCTVKGYYKDGEYHIQSIKQHKINRAKREVEMNT